MASLADLLRRGVAALNAGDIEAAERDFLAARRNAPHDPEPPHLLGLAAHRRGDATEAARLIREAIAIDGARPACHFNLGVVLGGLGDLAGAIAAYRRAAELRPSDAKAWNNLGVALGRAGELLEACAALRTAVARAPGFVEARVNLCAALARLGRPDEVEAAIAEGQAAVEAAPRLAAAHGALAAALAAAGRVGEAVQVAARASSLAPQDAAAALELARLALRHSQPARAAEAAALAERLGAAVGAGLRGVALLRQDDAASALELLDGALAEGWSEDWALIAACRGQALLALGRREEAAAWLGLDRLIGERRLTPPGRPDLAAFNEALAAAVLAHPTLRREPPGYVSRGGWLTGNLLLSEGPIFRTLEAALREAIDGWAAALAGLDHPFARARPAGYRLVSWASLLQAGGSLGAHIHEGSWASGAYYVRVPRFDPARNAGDASAGWIEFGVAPMTLRREPREGRILLFPSSLHHRTLDFRDEGWRLTISFNCYPFSRRPLLLTLCSQPGRAFASLSVADAM